jgi:hypothetical protein
VAHIYNPSYLGSRDRRIMAQGQPGQKNSFKNKMIKVKHTCNLNFVGSINRTLDPGLAQVKSMRPYLKNRLMQKI